MKLFVLTILALALLVSPAMAASTLIFLLPPHPPGTISYKTGANPLVGKNITISKVTDGSTTFNLVGGKLNFTSGNLTGTTANSYSFGGGGTISLTATCINNGGPCDADGDDTTPSGALLSGSFNSAGVLDSGTNLKLAFSAFTDVKDPNLLALFGITPSPFTGLFDLNFTASGSPPSGFTSTSITGLTSSVTNTNAAAISEPASLALVGCGLLGMGLFARKKLRAR